MGGIRSGQGHCLRCRGRGPFPVPVNTHPPHGGSHMARMQWIGLSFLGLALGSVGCVPAEKYNAMKLAHDSSMERLAQADAQARAATAEADAYKRQLESLMSGGNSRDAMVANITAQLTE